MLYLNLTGVVPEIKKLDLTLTSVVFEFFKIYIYTINWNNLTLTSVVFEFCKMISIFKCNSYLTLTSVVFEFL